MSATALSVGSASHVSVLRAEVLAAMELRPGGHYIDGTFGAGGYSAAMLDAQPGTRVLALDRDRQALVGGAALVGASEGRLVLIEACFGDMGDVAVAQGLGPFDGVVLDIGVSSMQIDTAARGFSFRSDGPLDMRMGGDGPSAADLVNGLSEEALANVIYCYGEERYSRPIARAILAARRVGRIETTRALADLVGRIVRHRPGDIHPATRTFQGLRIAVNDELGELVRGLHAAERLLKPGGRLAVVSFHSLEDRIVKQFLAARSGKGGGSRHAPVQVTGPATFRIEGKWPRVPEAEEVAANPRARSAKLRMAIRTEAPARDEEAAVAALARLPEPRKGRR